MYVGSVMSYSLRPHGLKPAKLLCPWTSPGKNNGVGCHFLLQGSYWVGQNSPWGHKQSDTTEWLSLWGFPCGSAGKEPACNAGDLSGLGRSPKEAKGYPLQYSGLKNSMDCYSPWGRRESDMTERLSLTELAKMFCCFFFVTQMNFLAKSILGLFKHTYISKANVSVDESSHCLKHSLSMVLCSLTLTMD